MSMGFQRDGNDPRPIDELLVEMQAELRAMAGQHMARERANHTLQPTALMNEAYLRLVQQKNLAQVSRAAFLAAASVTMRRLLIDHARQAAAKVRGGDRERVTISDCDAVTGHDRTDVLDLDAALEKLAARDARVADVVTCRYFGGMTVDEIAEAKGLSARTIADDLAFAKAWLRRELSR